ncbi:hypothetical protein INR49_003195 [Caranx melampygus]|nr:hypothetical protein INR49_003195 [Caranx melampygus]
MDCVRLFTKEDVLDGDEKPTCYRYLKRFSEARRTSKLSTFVNFPMKDLDLREFASENSITPMSSSQVRSSDAYVLFYELTSSSRM